MERQGISSAIPPQWWDRLKGAQFGFIIGIFIGLVFGWIFHGIISMAVRFGLLVVLLLPLIVIGWLWFRSRRTPATPNAAPGRSQVRTSGWTAVIDVPTPPQRAQPDPAPSDPFVDVPLVRPRAESRPDDIEAQLEELKRQQERGT